MRRYGAVLFICIWLFGTPAVAGPGHGHSHGPVTSDVVVEKAAVKVEQLAQAGKIDINWAGVQPVSVEQKDFANGPEWVIVFKNDKVSDTSKQNLYLFYSLDGSYLAANYTGK